MEKETKQATEKMSSRLQTGILRRIRIENLAKSKRLVLFGVAALVSSFAVFGIVATVFGGEIIRSETIQFVSLFFSDPKIVLMIGYNYLLSVLESLPITYISLILMAVFAVLSSARYAARYANKVSKLRSRLTPQI